MMQSNSYRKVLWVWYNNASIIEGQSPLLISCEWMWVERKAYIGFIPIFDDRRQILFSPLSFLRRPLFKPFLHFGSTTSSAWSFGLAKAADLFSLPTLTVAIIRKSGPGRDKAKQVNSKKLECSEYGTPIHQSLLCRVRKPRTIHHKLPTASSLRL